MYLSNTQNALLCFRSNNGRAKPPKFFVTRTDRMLGTVVKYMDFF